MSEDIANSLSVDSTNPLPFEEFVRQHLTMLVKQGNELREQQVKLQEQQDALREEMIERFLQLSRQIVELNARSGKIEEEIGKVREDIRDLEDKVDPFIREQLKLKRDLRELLENRAV